MALARTRAKRKYNEANYYRVALTIPIGLKEPLKEYAAANNTTVNSLLNNHVAELLGDTNTSTNTNTSTIELVEEINDLKKRLEVALKMNAIQENQELLTLKSEISKTLKLDYIDFYNSRGKEYSESLFAVYRTFLARTFRELKKLGISFDDADVSVNDTSVSTDDTSTTIDGTSVSADGTSTTIEPENKPIKKKTPSQEQLQAWHELNQSGKSFSDIEKMPEANGYKRSAIHRHVSAYRKTQGV